MKRLKVDGLFFDLDGTIVDSREAYFEAAKIAFHTIGQKTLNYLENSQSNQIET